MKNLSIEKMEQVEGGDMDCGMAYAGLAIATVSLFAAPFTGGLSMGLLAFGGFVTGAYGAEVC
jgi:hypothetical protein